MRTLQWVSLLHFRPYLLQLKPQRLAAQLSFR
jgi:hypothetical protein